MFDEYSYYWIIPAAVLLFFIWLLYRIKRRVTRLVQNKVYDEMPFIRGSFDRLQKKIDYLTTCIESLEKRVDELEARVK